MSRMKRSCRNKLPGDALCMCACTEQRPSHTDVLPSCPTCFLEAFNPQEPFFIQNLMWKLSGQRGKSWAALAEGSGGEVGWLGGIILVPPRPLISHSPKPNGPPRASGDIVVKKGLEPSYTAFYFWPYWIYYVNNKQLGMLAEIILSHSSQSDMWLVDCTQIWVTLEPVS